ncbi:MAG TPA: hypothetical protein VGJ18_18730 [Gemmatimonadaceae bacterium]
MHQRREFIVGALREVFRYARWARIPVDQRAHWVAELLFDVAITLGDQRHATPRHLGAYVTGACRLRVRETRERDATYRARIVDALSDIHENTTGFRQIVVDSLCSERSVRDARGPDWEPVPLAPVLERLVSAFDEGITEDERTMLRWLGAQISYTRIAEWLGITRPAAVSRIQRLRARLIEAAFRFVTELDLAERVELVRFLRRTGAVSEERILALEMSKHSPLRTTTRSGVGNEENRPSSLWHGSETGVDR